MFEILPRGIYQYSSFEHIIKQASAGQPTGKPKKQISNEMPLCR